MKILIVNKSIAMMRGGGETRTLAFAGGLVARGHEVSVLCAHPMFGRPRHRLPETLRPIAVESPYLRDWSYRLPRGRGVLARLDERLFDGRAFRAIAALAGPSAELPGTAAELFGPSAELPGTAAEPGDASADRSGASGSRIDVVLTFGLYPLAWRVSRALGIPTVVANSGGLPADHLAGAVRGVDAIIADGFDVDAIPRRFGVDVIEVRKGVDTARFRPRASDDRSRSPTRLLFVGRLVPVKSVHTLLPLLERLVDSGHDVRLDVVGDGPLRAPLARESRRRSVLDRVRFLGHLPPGEVAERYRDADLFVLPSSFDNYPNAVLEAMASGLPVVAFDVGGVGQQVRHDETGLLAPAGDEGALAAHVATLVSDPGRRRRMGERARAVVMSSHSWPVAIDRLQEVLTAVAGRGRSGSRSATASAAPSPLASAPLARQPARQATERDAA